MVRQLTVEIAQLVPRVVGQVSLRPPHFVRPGMRPPTGDGALDLDTRALGQVGHLHDSVPGLCDRKPYPGKTMP
ncbi:hypothetical protein ACWEK5_21785 [Rhodococcus koreensis]